MNTVASVRFLPLFIKLFCDSLQSQYLEQKNIKSGKNSISNNHISDKRKHKETILALLAMCEVSSSKFD